MKKIHIYLPLLLLILSGCFATMPEVNNAFIKNRNDSEKTDLYKIQNDIIAINREIKEQEKISEVMRQKLTVIKKKISLLEYRKPWLEEVVKLYILMEDGEKLGKARGELTANDEDMKFNNELADFTTINVSYQAARVEGKQAELSVKIAEQELEKAYINSRGNTGQQPDAVKESKPELKYKDVPCAILSKGLDVNVCKIAEQYNDRRKILSDRKQELDVVSAKFLDAEKNIKKYNKLYDF